MRILHFIHLYNTVLSLAVAYFVLTTLQSFLFAFCFLQLREMLYLYQLDNDYINTLSAFQHFLLNGPSLYVYSYRAYVYNYAGIMDTGNAFLMSEIEDAFSNYFVIRIYM